MPGPVSTVGGGAVRPSTARGRVGTLASRSVRRWNAFWFPPMDATPLRWIRVGAGLVASAHALELLPLLGKYYAVGGRFPIEEARAVARGQWVSVLLVPWLEGRAVVGVLHAGLLAALALLVAGWRVRVTAPLAYVLLLWFQLRMPLYLDGGDEVLRFTLLYLAVAAVLFPGAVGRARAAAGRNATDMTRAAAGRGTVPAWTIRLFQVQVALMYFLSGYWKVTGSAWWDGSAVYVAMQNPSFARFEVPDQLAVQPLLAAVGIAIAWWEFLFPALVSSRRLRRATLLFGVTIHLGILATMNIGLFPLAVLATYPAFVAGDRLRAEPIRDLATRAPLLVRSFPR